MLRVIDTLQCDEFLASGQELCNWGFSFNKKYRWLSKKEIGCLIFFKEIVLIKGIRKLEEEIASTKRKNFLNDIKRNTIPLGNIVPFWGKTNCMREDRNDQVNRLTSLQYKLDLFSGAMEWCWWFLCVCCGNACVHGVCDCSLREAAFQKILYNIIMISQLLVPVYLFRGYEPFWIKC